jgi:hypothetical protein
MKRLNYYSEQCLLIAPDLKYFGDCGEFGTIFGEYCMRIFRYYLNAVGLFACLICSAVSHLYLRSMMFLLFIVVNYLLIILYTFKQYKANLSKFTPSIRVEYFS